MRNKQLLYLSLCTFIILFVGMGLFPVLPSYDAQFGATRTVVGIHFALMYAANVAGHMLAGDAERFTGKGRIRHRRDAGNSCIGLLGYATALGHVIALTAIAWFCGGVGFALVGVFTGLHADRDSRGRSFVMTFLAYPLGATFGGATVGRLVAWQGYPVMFAVLGAVWAFLPLSAC
jgi:MFS family permease